MDLQKATSSSVNNEEEISSENDPVWLCESLPRASKCMEQKLELLAPSKYSEPPCRELLNVPLSDTKKNKLVKSMAAVNIYSCNSISFMLKT